jgi:hypothetical protein
MFALGFVQFLQEIEKPGRYFLVLHGGVEGAKLEAYFGFCIFCITSTNARCGSRRVRRAVLWVHCLIFSDVNAFSLDTIHALILNEAKSSSHGTFFSPMCLSPLLFKIPIPSEHGNPS